jgi:hypothetical protein
VTVKINTTQATHQGLVESLVALQSQLRTRNKDQEAVNRNADTAAVLEKDISGLLDAVRAVEIDLVPKSNQKPPPGNVNFAFSTEFIAYLTDFNLYI